MRLLFVAATLLAACLFNAPASAAQGAGVQVYLGKTVTDVEVQIAGVAVAEPGLLELIETRVAEPLGMREIRATIDHLVGLGRFEDVRVFATVTEQGVALRWQLIPVKRITKISITGNAGFSESTIRAELSDRFGALPSVSRIDEMVTTAPGFLRRSWLRERVDPAASRGRRAGARALRAGADDRSG